MTVTEEDFKGLNYYAFDAYFDESGNTGLNLFDPAQPLYVAAGWMVPREVEQQAVQLVKNANSALPGQRPELKGSKLLRKRRHDSITVTLLDGLLS